MNSHFIYLELLVVKQCANMGPEKSSQNYRARQGQSKGECVLWLFREQGVCKIILRATVCVRYSISWHDGEEDRGNTHVIIWRNSEEPFAREMHW